MWAGNLEISPLNHAEKIAVPLLTAHGENDTRVMVEEVIKMWDLVKRNGVHSELIVAEKEGHGTYALLSIWRLTLMSKKRTSFQAEGCHRILECSSRNVFGEVAY